MEKERSQREMREELCRYIERDLRRDPACPSYIIASLDVARAVQGLCETAKGLIDVCDPLIDAEKTGVIREIEQYAKLVTEGIKQYLAAINERPKTGGAT